MALTAEEQKALDELNGKPAAKPAASASASSPAPTPQAGPEPLPVKAVNEGKKQVKDALLPLVPVFTGAARAVGTAVNPVFDILNRPHEAATAAETAGPLVGLKTLVHGQSPESQDQTRAEIRKMMGFEGDNPSGFYKLLGIHGGGPKYSEMPHWEQGVIDLLVDTAHDPTTYVGGLGILEHTLEAAGVRATPAISRMIRTMQTSANPRIAAAGHGLATAYDFTHFKGATKRALAANSGEEGINQYRGLKSINNARRKKATDLGRTLTDQYHDAIKDLSPEEEDKLYRAIHTGTVAQLPADMQARAAAFKQVTDQLAHLSGNPELRENLANEGFELPGAMQRFEPETPRGLQDTHQYRAAYVPTAHDVSKFKQTAEADKGIMGLDQTTHNGRTLSDILQNPTERVERKTPGLDSSDPSLRERTDKARILAPEMQRKVIESRLRGGAQAIAAADAEREVTKLFGAKAWKNVPNDAKSFFQETYKEPGGKEFWTGLLKGAVDVPKVGLFALPFRHMANIASLSFLADPSLANVFGTAGKFMRLMLDSNPEARAKVLGKAGKYGVTGTPSVDRELHGVGGWIGKIPLVGDVYKASNHILWTFDDAAKATRFDRLLKKYQGEGLDESHAAYRAADEVSAELIDYSNRSPLTQALAYIAPFATYRSKVPGAIARTATRHPERILAAGRASPELVGDVQQAPPDEQGRSRVGKSYLPLPETLRSFSSPAGFGQYARATLGWPEAIGGSLVGSMAEKMAGKSAPDVAHVLTYGKDPDLKYLVNATMGSFPGGEAALGLAGQGEFQNQGSLSGAIRGQTGFGIGRGPTPTQLQLPKVLAAAQAAADAARAKGDKTTAQAIERAMETVRERYREYIP